VSAEETFVVAGCRPWNRSLFEEIIAGSPGRWVFVGARDELTASALERLDPRYVFLLHWSWLVPEEIWARWECVGFHMGDLPRDRGGSPLQNLILDGRAVTRLNAFRITDELDGGPVYASRELSLDGRAEDIYRRAGRLSAEMIQQIVAQRPEPTPQTGQPSHFRRRRPDESEIPEGLSVEQTYDFIRMLDADGYPHAFVKFDRFRLTFRDAVIDDGVLSARAVWSEDEEGT
jgi:methionyl-tRNA formyltransferase